jgi:hypothetical protein
MKHQYVGDEHDYQKYGLLRCFASVGLNIGVCWMVTPEDRRPDGGKTQYLSSPNEWKEHDTELFDHLAQLVVAAEGRHLRHIEEPSLIPRAVFYGAMVPDARAERETWFKNMLDVLSNSSLLFFDPDNGIEVPSKRFGYKDSSKYVYWKELTETWKHGKSLLVYQHFPRKDRKEYISERVREMELRLPDSIVMPIGSTNVIFLLVYRFPDVDRITAAVELIKRKWSHRIEVT